MEPRRRLPDGHHAGGGAAALTTDPVALLAGGDVEVPLVTGAPARYAHLDHAASTPPLRRALAAVREAADWYANVHRGAGAKSRRTTTAYEQARDRVARAVHADAAQVTVFVRNATEALNLLARHIPVPRGHVVVVTAMEHHSNDLPWRRSGPVVRAETDAHGRVDEDQLRDLLRAHRGRVAALAVTAASNVTGLVNPVHRWARWAHEAGASIVVDAAQRIPHRPLDCRPADDPEHLDAVAFSAHKCYAPFGVGVLVASRALLGAGEPILVGGGTVDAVGDDYVAWAPPPERHEAGTPCVLGAIALAAALDALEAIAWDAIHAYETGLARVAHGRLRAVPGLRIHGDPPEPFDPAERLGTFSFTLGDRPHALVAAVLDHEWGIGVRSGCHCAHPYVKRLLGLTAEAIAGYEARVVAGDRAAQPGLVRVSLGLATRSGDLDRLGEALTAVARGDHRDDYVEDPATGVWAPAGAAELSRA